MYIHDVLLIKSLNILIMIVYGFKSVHLNTKQIINKVCPNCNSKGTLFLSVFRKHAQVFWIPLFPVWKTGLGQCSNCKHEFRIKELPENIKIEYENLKADSKGPLWQFTGLGLIVCIVAWASYASGETELRELEYIESPLAGDVYDYKLETGNYSTLKVDRVTSDSVFIFENQYEINRISKIHRIDKPENYYNISYGISRAELKAMHTSGEIMSIDRD